MSFKSLWNNRFHKARKETSPQVAVKRQRQIRQTYERNLQAITFAEADAHDLARQILTEPDLESPKILVVSSLTAFSPVIVDYAIRLAGSIACQVVAVNVFTDLWSKEEHRTVFDNLRWEVFSQQAADAVTPFRFKAEKGGIPFRHIIQHGPLKQVMRQIETEIKRIRFIVTAPEIAADEMDQKAGTPVFSFRLSES
ncbi:MAG: hypothetical protein A2V65_09290 [Deltaproteobacteria bacterium RBG_13_49_15]|nr:MAG: hypothetical protein A2V65_09290 [Deltaproteobacteria bacterium RBG_13_49_15]